MRARQLTTESREFDQSICFMGCEFDPVFNKSSAQGQGVDVHIWIELAR